MPMPATTRNFNAEGAIAAYSIVKFGANDFGALQAAASSDLLAGVSTDIAAVTGEPCDVVMEGIASVKINGTVTRGNYITSDASGLGVAVGSTAGTNYETIGKALQSGVAGDIIDVLISIGRVQG